MSADAITLLLMLSFLVGAAFLAAYGVVLWLVEGIQFVVHLWRTR